MDIHIIEVIKDLENYISLFGIELSEESKKFIKDSEIFANKCDNPVTEYVYLSFLISNTDMFKNLFVKNNLNAELAIYRLRKEHVDCLDDLDHYLDDFRFYSTKEKREIQTNTGILDMAMESCIYNGRKQIYNVDFIEALLQYYEKGNKSWDNGRCGDERLHVPYNTLAHILGRYCADLWIKFDDVGEEIKLINKQLSLQNSYKVA